MADIFQDALKLMVGRVDETAAQLKGAFPHFADAKGDWTTTPDGDWTGGFWPGMCWLAAKATAGARYRRWALEWAERLRPRATSDTAFRGFLFYYSAVLGAVLFNDPAAREIALDGARHWARTYNPNAGCFPLGDAAEEAADVPPSRVAYWDFDAPAGPDTEHDSSATAITAAALLKLAAALKDAQRRKEIRAAAEGTVRVLVEGYLDTRGILDRGCYSKRNNVATRNELIWGSYYLFEALCVLTGKLDAAKI